METRRSRRPINPNLPLLVREWYGRFEASNKSWKSHAHGSGNAMSTMCNWTQGHDPRLSHFAAAVQDLGGRVVIVWDKQE